jgi:hypothetical protein
MMPYGIVTMPHMPLQMKKWHLKIIDLETMLQGESDDCESKIDELLNEILLLTKKRALEVQNMKKGGT